MSTMNKIKDFFGFTEEESLTPSTPINEEKKRKIKLLKDP